ncbi:MAG: DUF1043 family protein [Sedimenticola sp.]
MSPFWIFVVSFAAGAGIGVFIAYQMRSGKDCKLLKQQLEELNQEYDDYKQGVGKHFVETSTLINNLTQSYKEVHQHLSKGAQTLCPEDVALELQRSTVPLIRDAIEGESKPHEPEQPEETPRQEAPAPPAETAAKPAAEDQPVAEEKTSEPPEPKPPAEVEEPVDFPQQKETAAPRETVETAPEPAEKEKTAAEEEEPQHLNMEDVVRHAQGMKGRPETEENLADIARHAEGAYLEEEPPEPELTAEQIAEAERLAAQEAEQEKAEQEKAVNS